MPFHSLLDSLYQSGRLRSTAKRGWERGQQWGHRTVTRWQEKVLPTGRVVVVVVCLCGFGCGGHLQAARAEIGCVGVPVLGHGPTAAF